MKNFDEWNNQKKNIDFKTEDVLPKKKEVWWLSIGLNVGVEEDGKNNDFERLVLVIKTFSRQCFLGIPITSSDKKNKKYYFPIKYKQENYYLILSQIRLFSTKRLTRKIYDVETEEFMKMKKELRKVIGL